MGEPSRAFAVKAGRGARGMLLGAGILGAGGVVVALLAVVMGNSPAFQSAIGWVAAPACLGGVFAFIVGMTPRAATLRVQGTTLVPSWSKRRVGLEQARLSVGRWVLGGLDTPQGVALQVEAPEGRLVIGGQQHVGDGYALTAPPRRSVDCQLGHEDFDALARLVGVERVAVDPDVLVVELTKSSQTAGGGLRMMAPWFATMGVASLFGLIVGATGLGDALAVTAVGPYVIGGITTAIVVGGLILTIGRGMRVRLPELKLTVTPAGLALARASSVEMARVAWAGVRAKPGTYRFRTRGGSYSIPLIELGLGSAEPVVMGAWDPSYAWGGEVARYRRGPRYLVGSVHWGRLVERLRGAGVLGA